MITTIAGCEYRYTEWADFNTAGFALKVSPRAIEPHTCSAAVSTPSQCPTQHADATLGQGFRSSCLFCSHSQSLLTVPLTPRRILVQVNWNRNVGVELYNHVRRLWATNRFLCVCLSLGVPRKVLCSSLHYRLHDSHGLRLLQPIG